MNNSGTISWLERLESCSSRNSGLGAKLGGLVLVLALGSVDYLTGNEISFSIFYLVPVSWASWCAGRRVGFLISLLSALTWYWADLMGATEARIPPPTQAWIPIWNAIMRLLIFLIMSALLSRFRESLWEAKAARKTADEATQMKAEFLATMSHEIRTPLNAVLGVADLLTDTRLTKEQADYVGILRAEGRRLRGLVNDILDISKLESGRLEFEQIPFSLVEVLDASVSTFSNRASEKGLFIRTEFPKDLPAELEGDPHRLRQVIDNLISNAIKFTERGGVTVRVQVVSSQETSCVINVAVIDAGVGISPEQQKKLFERFTQADASVTRRFGGSGLGLSIVKLLLDGMGGQIGVTSTVGAGSTFHFSLNLKIPPLRSIKRLDPNLTTEAAESIRNKIKPIRILLAEDYATNRMLVQAYLRPTECRLDIAENGRIACDMFLQNPYDLILMDMNMPEMDGHEATRQIRSLELSKQQAPVPIIALTASALPEERQRCTADGCTHFLAKPFDRTNLLEMILKIVGAPENPTPPSPSHSLPLPDLTTLDPDLVELMPQVLADLESARKEIEKALAANDLPTIAQWGHKVAGMGATFGFKRISEQGRTMEASFQEGDTAQIHRAAKDFLAEFQHPNPFRTQP